MSTTTQKRKLHDALHDAEVFRDLFPRECYERWEIAGSIRRKRPECGDVEHVIIPAFGDKPAAGLFAQPERVNLLWHHADALVAGHAIDKHWNGNGLTWGEKMRRADYRGFSHDIFTAMVDNWGCILAIRTGSADFSKRLVTGLLRNQYRQADGYVWRCRPCPHCARPDPCKACNGTRLDPVERLSVGTEEEFFSLAGVMYVQPEARV